MLNTIIHRINKHRVTGIKDINYYMELDIELLVLNIVSTEII